MRNLATRPGVWQCLMDTPSRDLYCDNIIMIALRISMQRGYSMMDEDVLLDGICDSLQDTGYEQHLQINTRGLLHNYKYRLHA